MKKIAIVGAGFSGLGLCYHLLKEEGEKEITVFDGKGVGGGASGIASGLLHPFPGESARLSWKGREAMAATLELLRLVGPEVYKETGLLKLALTDKQQKALRERAEKEADIEWWDEKRCLAAIPGGRAFPGIFIRSGVTVHAALYLKGLWEVCERLGAQLAREDVDLEDLGGFDQVVLCAGAGIRRFGLDLPIKCNKGHVLITKKPSYWTLKSSLIGKGYLALSENEEICYLGSTYEQEYVTETPCLGIATDLIFKQVDAYLSSYGAFEVLGCKAEMRVVNRKRYHPIVGEVQPGVFVITAMGSRGLLYHSYLGRALAMQMCARVLEEVS